MKESKKIRASIEKTQKEWGSLSLEEKKDKTIEYLQSRFDSSETQEEQHKFSMLIMSIDLSPDHKAEELVEAVHESIIGHALELEKEALEREAD